MMDIGCYLGYKYLYAQKLDGARKSDEQKNNENSQKYKAYTIYL